MKRSLCMALIAALACSAQAELADRNKPMNIEADNLRYDEANQTSTFTGRVVATKGTIVLRGSKLDVRQQADGGQLGVLVAEAGQRAFFRQKREGVDEYIEGEAERIEYDGRKDEVTLINRAEVRRLRGAALQDQISGKVIVYNNVTSVFSVDSTQNSAQNPAVTGAGSSPGRVRAIFGPKEPAAPPPSSVTPPLKPSPSLGSAPQ